MDIRHSLCKWIKLSVTKLDLPKKEGPISLLPSILKLSSKEIEHQQYKTIFPHINNYGKMTPILSMVNQLWK